MGLPRLVGRHPLTTAAPPSGARGDLSFWTSPQPEVRAARPLLGGPSGCSCQPTEAPRPGFVPQPRRVAVRGAAVSPAQSFGVVDMNDELPMLGGGKPGGPGPQEPTPNGAGEEAAAHPQHPPVSPPGMRNQLRGTQSQTRNHRRSFLWGPMGTYGDVWE